MDAERFYDIIERARGGTGPAAPSADAAALRDELDVLDDDDLVGFAAVFEHEHAKLNRWALWGAGFLAQGGMSDDGFHSFRSWLIGKGLEAVDTAVTDPDDLAEYFGSEDLDNEVLEYAAIEALEDRGLEQPPPVDSTDPLGEEFDEGALEQQYPQIARLVRSGARDPH